MFSELKKSLFQTQTIFYIASLTTLELEASGAEEINKTKPRKLVTMEYKVGDETSHI
jgi:hypothetical protein